MSTRIFNDRAYGGTRTNQLEANASRTIVVLAGEFDRSVTLACPVFALGNAPTTITTTTTVVLVVLLVLLPRIEGEKRGCIRIRCVQGERKEKRREMYACMCVRMREREREREERGRSVHTWFANQIAGL